MLKEVRPELVIRLPNGGSFLFELRTASDIFTPEDFSEQHRLIEETAEQFMQREVFPRIEQLEHQEPGLTQSLLREAGKLGLLSLDIPERFGGMALDKVSSTIVAERLAQYAGFGASFSGHTVIGSLPIVYFGTEAQKEKYLPRLASGELISAYCLSEAGAGTDALAARAHALLSPDGKQYLLNGEKMWITNGGIAGLYVVFAKIDGEKFSCFLVERGFRGVSAGPEEKKMGLKGSSTCALVLDNVQVPAENLLGEPGRGHIVAFNILNIGRFKLAAKVLGAAKNTFQHALRYSQQRRAFGRAIAEFGLMQEKLAEMAARIFTGESIVYRTAGLLDAALTGVDQEAQDAGTRTWKVIEEYAIECSINKVYLTEVLAYVADECVQIHGGYGYHQDYPAERAYRDARISRIYEGTNEINRLVITNMLLKRIGAGRLPKADGGDWGGEAATASDEHRLVSGAKRLALLALQAAQAKLGDELPRQQEVVAAISDLIMEAFALESALLRADKLEQKFTPERAAHAQRMARLMIHTRLDAMEARARTALAGIGSPSEVFRRVRALTDRDPVDVISLRRQIAAHVLARGKYSV